MTKHPDVLPDHAQEMLALVQNATIPVQAYRIQGFSHRSPSARSLLDAVGIGKLYEHDGEQVVDLPVRGLLNALDLAARLSPEHSQDAATLMGIVYHGSWPQYAAGEWRTPQEIYDAMFAAITPTEEQCARLALEAFVGLATLTYAVELADGVLPDDDEGTVASIQQVLTNGGLYDDSSEPPYFQLDKLLEAEKLRQSQLADAETVVLFTRQG